MPRELIAAKAREHVDRNVHRHAVVNRTRLESVRQGQFDTARQPRVGPVGARRVVGAKQIVAGERQQVRCRVPLLLPPCVEVSCGDDICRYTCVVQREDVLIADEKVTPARAILELLQLCPQPRVVAEEMVTGLPLPLDKRVLDEQVARQRRIDLPVVHATACHKWQAVQRHPLVGHHRAARSVPVRLAVCALHKMGRDAFDVLRLNPCGRSSVEPAGLDEVGDDDPARRTLGEDRTRCEDELGVPCALEFTGIAFAHTDVR